METFFEKPHCNYFIVGWLEHSKLFKVGSFFAIGKINHDIAKFSDHNDSIHWESSKYTYTQRIYF